MYRTKIIFSFLILIPLIGLFSCSTTKHVPEGDYLLRRYKINTKDRKVEKSEIKKYIRQKPNRRFLGLNFPLYLYSLSNPEKQKGLSKWLRKVGEEPVIWDPYLMEESRKQILNHLEKKGYYDSQVRDSVIYDDQKVTVQYNVEAKKPYRVSDVDYRVKDSVLRPFLYPDTANLPVDPGDVFSVELLQQERSMIEGILRDNGFYHFSKDFVSFIADTSARTNQVKLTVEVNPFTIDRGEGALVTRAHQRFQVDSVYIFPNYAPRQAIADRREYIRQLDTIEHKGLKFVYSGPEPGIDLDVIRQSNYIKPGAWYSKEETDKTYQHLNSLRLFQIINIKYQESQSPGDSLAGELDCHIYLRKFKLQSYTIELEGTNSSGNIGGAGNLVYTHKSIFGGAEQFQSKFTGAFEILDQEKFNRIDNTMRLGTEVSLDFPQFLLPFLRSDRFVKQYDPKTNLSAMYNYQERPDYTRTLANVTFGYRWKSKNYLTHYVNPLELNILRLPYLSASFKRNLEEIYLKSSYEDHFLSVTSYSMIYNNQDVQKTRDFQYFRLNAEVAGNVLTAFSKLADFNKVGDHYEIFGIRYAQYFRVDFDFRHYQILDDDERFVYRLFVGTGFPYGNSNALPFVKQYFSGGANSIRAWNVRALGPGGYTPRQDFRGYPNLTGDIKLEANWEYRFKMFWILEGAYFLDAGNIWSLNPRDDRLGAQFDPNDFLSEVAIGTGLGLRFDLSFSVLRLDVGLKLKDPSYPPGKRWLPGNRRINKETLSWNIAIGYPF